MGKLTTPREEREVYDGAESAIARLRNNSLPVDTSTKEIVIKSSQRQPGIKLWGAIDYLKRFHNYSWVRRR